MEKEKNKNRNKISDSDLSLITAISSLENKLEELDHNITVLSKRNLNNPKNVNSDKEINQKIILLEEKMSNISDKINDKKNLPININYTNAQEHVPRAERNNRIIQERTRSNYYQIPYERFPRIITKYLVMEAPKKIDFFPSKHEVSKYYRPYMILHQENLDFNKHCT